MAAFITSRPTPKSALSHADREIRTAEVMGDLLACECDEAALVWLAQSQGLPIEFRHDCSPLAILQVRMIVVTNGHDAAPPSSWMHAYDRVSGGGRK